MTATARQIVVDKDAFIGINLDALCKFAESHFLLLSDTLLYECATATRQVPKSLLRRYECIVKAGAHYCSMSRQFAEWEAWHCRPFPQILDSEDMTEGIRRGNTRISSLLASDALQQSRDGRAYAAHTMSAQFSAYLKSQLHTRVKDVRADINKIPNSPSERLRNWFGRIDAMDIHAMAVESFLAGWIRVKGEFCLSPTWMTWQHLRLVMASIYEHWYIRETGDPRDRYAEHDWQDAEYVLLLSRADAIITRDRRSTELAKAAFPEKDVFSGLEEVPDSYRCDWAGL